MIVFDSRNERYKKPFGALRAGENLHLLMESDEPFCEMHFVPAPDGGAEQVYPMRPTDGGWEIDLTFEKADLYFYRFEGVLKNGNHVFIGKGEDSSAVIGDWLPRFSLTVYEADFTTPEKFRGGTMYQIFPDRFARVGRPQQSARGQRFYHENTDELPFEYGRSDRPGGLDFYGGNLAGVAQKLPYLHDLGVTVIYFNPIFESAENHRYSTADYLQPDPWFATQPEFEHFCRTAKEYGISVILDGVFSHTGADSVYFNKYGHYDSVGAYNSPQSPYYNWYEFESYPDRYAAWWGFENLPNVKETDSSYLKFITGEDGVLAHWQKAGADGWRLDVADELPDTFLDALRRRVKQSDPEALIIGEVWENAVKKISYGARRRFLLGRQCDSVMNYPWREAIIQLIRTGNVSAFAESVQTLCEDYPPPVLDVLMNILSTHDSIRIITALGCEQEVPNSEKGTFRLSETALETARFRLRLAAVLQFTLPGIPSIYYGDEIGMQGFADPYNRAFYDEAHADGALRTFYGKLGAIRKKYRDDFGKRMEFYQASEGVLHYRRGNVGIWMCFGTPHAAPSQKSLLDVFDSSGRRIAVIYEKIEKN